MGDLATGILQLGYGKMKLNACEASGLRMLLVLLLVLVGGKHVRGEEAAPAEPDLSRFESEIRAFEAWDRQNSFPPRAVLFVGSSSIRKWQTAESFPDLPVINRGFGGSHVSEVNHFAERIVLKYSPRVIVFYAGDNDIADGKSPERVFHDFAAFAELVHGRLPETRLIYLPIKPSILRWSKWPQMQAANVLAEAYARDHVWMTYVDTATPMLGADGRPRPELFVEDGLHMNAEGYRLWSEQLRPLLKAELGAR
jgi:lysophospholipase L1-like esterase